MGSNAFPGDGMRRLLVSSDLWNQLNGRQEQVEGSLRSILYGHTLDVPGVLTHAMAYSLLAPGKRLRPLLAILACEAVGGTMDQALPAACAVEMVHTYSLIHDDLPAMDDDDLRRGLPTCHKKFGEALAILAGDALLTLAFEVLGRSYGPRTSAVSCVELATGAGAAGMVGGQVLDLKAEGKITYSGAREPVAHHGSCHPVLDLENLHRRKTGALFRSALRLGVHAAQGERPTGAHPSALACVDAYAAAFGLAFQVTDDLLDVESTSEKTGKGVGKDAGRGKLTYPGLLGVAESRRRARELANQAEAAARHLGS
jgi:geranylgeranyl diphosphate synthase type II